jgi:ribonuclease HI
MVEEDVNVVSVRSWELFFDGSVCNTGQGIGCVLVSPNVKKFELAIRLDIACTNNQVEYKALLYGLEYLKEMGVTGINAIGDSMLIMQQIKESSQCLDGVLNIYKDKCWEVIKTLEEFRISHVPREDNGRANFLAQQVLGYNVFSGIFIIKNSPGVHGMQVDNNWSDGLHEKGDHGNKKDIPESQGMNQ